MSNGPNVIEMALEPHYSIQQVAEMWQLSESAVRDIFRDEPGVFRVARPKGRYKRAYTTLRIPQSVVERVHRRGSNAA
jgi:hypothetical protein